MPRHFGFWAFAATQVVIDVETLYHLLRQEWPVHRVLHTYLGGTVVGVVVGVVAFALGELLRKWCGHGETARDGPKPADQRTTRAVAAMVGAVIGGISHALLDSIMHEDAQPLWPFATGNRLLGVIGVENLHLGCLVAGFVGLAIMLVNRAPQAAE